MQLGDAAPELVLPDAVGVVVDLAVHAAECPALVLCLQPLPYVKPCRRRPGSPDGPMGVGRIGDRRSEPERGHTPWRCA